MMNILYCTVLASIFNNNFCKNSIKNKVVISMLLILPVVTIELFVIILLLIHILRELKELEPCKRHH